jgi:hypothetical protein
LAAIAIEDKISKDTIKNYRSLAEIHYKDMLEERLKHDLEVSDITGISGGVSKRCGYIVLSNHIIKAEFHLWCQDMES